MSEKKEYLTSDEIVASQPQMTEVRESTKDFFVWIKSEKIIIKKSQISDWFKLLFLYPKPVWSGDVTSNKAVEQLRELDLCFEYEDGWHLTKKAICLIKCDCISIK